MDYSNSPVGVAARLQNREQCRRGSAVGHSPDGRTIVIIPMTCKSWLCDHCRPRKIGLWRLRIEHSKPQRFLTLTGIIRPYETLDLAVHRIARAWTTMVQHARKKFGPCDWLKVWELTKLGNPHLHILQRGPFWPQKWLSDQWEKLTGCPVVDIRRISQRGHAGRYVAKYISKTVEVFAEQCPNVRVVSCSRGFLLQLPPRSQAIDLKGYRWTYNEDDQWLTIAAFADLGYELVSWSSSSRLVILRPPAPDLTSIAGGVLHKPGWRQMDLVEAAA